MTHVLIVGITESGKTTLAQMLCRSYRKRGFRTIVLDPLRDPRWEADYSTTWGSEFLEAARLNRKCALFIDESGETIGRYNPEMLWLATRSRHYGHKSHFITQRAVQLNKTARDQCTTLFLFRVSMDDAKSLSNEFADDALKSATQLNQFEFFHKNRFSVAKKLHL